ncbi:class I SAM-dependent methyltransferase [Bradyrhizobium sp. 157]|uniref:class I SAM-dependent methyltransferase n=1 Tax=Bradyrhizobium sp. 157 TaxID=2782631 RepID=UPI001FF9E8DE|nr:class I SAM-dependent methyltransferase [Bradyrhizobium sp. 157]MCK1640780.1 class I SAM-dependent methyltransferase [Bradyrhizobium sp. 157]
MKLPRLVRQIGKRVVKTTPILRRHILTSTDYKVLDGVDEARRAAASSDGWLAARTVARQERAYRALIAEMKNGEPRFDFRIAAEAVAATGISNPRLLEIGCGSGYYSEVLTTLLSGGVRYTGIDYSDAMIARAREYYPAIEFEVADATKLPYANQVFDIAFNGVSLMHIIDYPAAIREAARVAARFCIFHSVPVFDHYRTTYLRKYAYGAPVVEVVFGRQELMSVCKDAGLRLVREWPGIPYDVHEVTGHHSSAATYLFARRAHQSGAITVRT